MPIGGGITQHDHSGATQGGAVLNAHVPAGRIAFFGHANQPATAQDWLECNGQNVSRTTYATLFANVGTTWGIGDGSTTFTLPDMRRRVPVGKGGSASGTLGNAAGNSGGSETLAVGQLPAHNHANGPNTFAITNTAGGINGGAAVGSLASDTTIGSGTAFYVPAVIGGWWIKT